jgi:alpha-ketoglutarate-dependent taurine dioxygenase
MRRCDMVQYRDFIARFGTLNVQHRGTGKRFNPEAPEITVISNSPEWGQLNTHRVLHWHANVSYGDSTGRVSKIGCFYGVKIPPPELGGNTRFANLQSAYESLDAKTKDTVENLEVLRSAKHSRLYNYHPDTKNDSELSELVVEGGIGPLRTRRPNDRKEDAIRYRRRPMEANRGYVPG